MRIEPTVKLLFRPVWSIMPAIHGRQTTEESVNAPIRMPTSEGVPPRSRMNSGKRKKQL